MTTPQPAQIFDSVSSKGWNLYARGPYDNKIPMPEAILQGPVQELEQDILYAIVPRVDEPINIDQVVQFGKGHQIDVPSINASRNFDNHGYKVYEFSGNDSMEDPIHPGENVQFTGFEIQEEMVRLLAQRKTYMPKEEFLRCLSSLQDISGLE